MSMTNLLLKNRLVINNTILKQETMIDNHDHVLTDLETSGSGSQFTRVTKNVADVVEKVGGRPSLATAAIESYYKSCGGRSLILRV